VRFFVSQSISVSSTPAVIYLPSWLPGTRFLQVGAEGRALRDAYAGTPFEQVKAEMVRPCSHSIPESHSFPQRAGTARPSFVSNLLASKGGPDVASAHDQDLIKWTASAVFVGGADTVRLTLLAGLHTELKRI
jgi:hypothetical protein